MSPVEENGAAMPERSFYLIVRGGSWGGGTPFRTYRAGVHEVSADVAQAVLAFKKQAPKASWLILSDLPPQLEDGSLLSLLLPEDMQPGVIPEGVRLLREENPSSIPGNEKDGGEARPPVYACQLCGARFPSPAAAKRHLRHNHVLQPDKVEARVRAQLEAELE